MESRTKFKRQRHGRWGGLHKIKMIGGVTRIKCINEVGLPTEQRHARRKAKKFRPLQEKIDRHYLNNDVRCALQYVAQQFLAKGFTPLLAQIYDTIYNKPDFELNESKDLKKWLFLTGLMMEFHRIRSKIVAAKNAKKDPKNIELKTKAQKEWYSNSKISCMLRSETIRFITRRLDVK